MADISACEDKKCPSRTICYRYLCVRGMWQSYMDFGRKKGQMRCKDFLDNYAVFRSALSPQIGAKLAKSDSKKRK